jgi:hypothetical protein
MESALRYDGIITAVHTDEHGWMQPSPAQLARITESIGNRTDAGYDVVVEGNTSRDPAKATATVRPYIDAGAPWWFEGVWSFLSEPETAVERMNARISAGPPS